MIKKCLFFFLLTVNVITSVAVHISNNNTCIRTNFVSVTLFSFAVIFVLSLFRTSFMICSTIQLLMVVTYKRCSFYSVLILKTKYSQRITDRTKCWSICNIYMSCTCISRSGFSCIQVLIWSVPRYLCSTFEQMLNQQKIFVTSYVM